MLAVFLGRGEKGQSLAGWLRMSIPCCSLFMMCRIYKVPRLNYTQCGSANLHKLQINWPATVGQYPINSLGLACWTCDVRIQKEPTELMCRGVYYSNRGAHTSPFLSVKQLLLDYSSSMCKLAIALSKCVFHDQKCLSHFTTLATSSVEGHR